MLAPTPCLEKDCRTHAVKQGRCQEHQKPVIYTSNRAARLPGDWRTRRLIVFKRDQGVCYLCGNPGADTVDHVIAGDDHSLNNLKAVHDRTPPHCHRYKTSQEGHEAKRGNRAKRRY